MTYEILSVFDLHNTAAIAADENKILAVNVSASKLFPGISAGDAVNQYFPEYGDMTAKALPAASVVQCAMGSFGFTVSAVGDINVITISLQNQEEKNSFDEFAKKVSYLLKKDLTTGKIAMSVLQTHIEKFGNPQSEKYGAVLSHSQHALLRTATNLHEFRNETGIDKNNYFNIILVLNELVGSINSFLGKDRKPIRFETDLKIFMVRGNRDEIESMFLNIISNSLKFTQNDADICITAQRRAKTVMISVTDNGEGIPQEIMAMLFRSYIIHKDIPSPKDGLGIGLAAAHNTAKRHGGKLFITSDGGTQVYVILPETEIPTVLREEILPYKSASRSSNILAGLSEVLGYENYSHRYVD